MGVAKKDKLNTEELRRKIPLMAKRIGLVFDLSGSRDRAEPLDRIYELVREAVTPGSEIMVAAGDTALKFPGNEQEPTWENFSENLAHLGGGGTDMGRVAWQAYFAQGKPDALILVTDGFSNWPTSATSVKVGEELYNALPPGTLVLLDGTGLSEEEFEKSYKALPEEIQRQTVKLAQSKTELTLE